MKKIVLFLVLKTIVFIILECFLSNHQLLKNIIDLFIDFLIDKIVID